MSKTTRDAKVAVGYGRPPEEHRFKPGVSGNPGGRPPRRPASSATPLNRIVMEEARRLVTVVERGQEVEMPVAQAVLRAMSEAALGGDARARTNFMALAQAADQAYAVEFGEAVEKFHAYKEHWRIEFERCDLLRHQRPDPFPHPDDIVLDLGAGRVRLNGPISRDDKAIWDKFRADRDTALEIIAQLRSERPRSPNRRAENLRFISQMQSMADQIDGVFPSAATRRKPGFDLVEWRETHQPPASHDQVSTTASSLSGDPPRRP